LENLLKKASEIPQNKRRETLILNKDKALISKQLVTLKNDVPIKDDATNFIIKEINKDKLYNFLRDMEFNRLLSQAISFYGEPGNKDFNKKTQAKINNKINTKTYRTILKEKQLNELIKKLDEKSVIAVDTETSSLNPQEADLVGISICYEANQAYYIPLGHKEKTELEKNLILKKIKPILEDVSIKKVGQNIKYDFIIFKNEGIELSPVDDTMLLSYTLDAGNNRHNMDTLSELHLGHKSIS
jgi:DNA polymerase I - 3''-5'' exonuclease and polymerase domains